MDGEEQPEPFSDDYKKRNGVDNNKNHNRVGVQPRKGRAREKPKEKVVTAQALEREKVFLSWITVIYPGNSRSFKIYQ